MRIKIVSDNCCDLPEDLLQRYNISIAHLLVRFGERVYEPGEMSTSEFYDKLKSSSFLPRTTQPSIDEMIKVYSQALADGSQVIAIHMSSGISGTFQGGQLAQNMLDNPRLHVFDSKKASVGQGLLVLEAARLAEQGVDLIHIMERLEEMRRRMQCIFLVGNLEALIKGGRISRAKGMIAEVLDIKPILFLDENGCIVPYDKVRGQKAALKKLINIMEKNGSELSRQTVGVVHGACPEKAEYLRREIEERFGVREVIVGQIGPVIGAHVGAGTFSVFFEK